MHRRTLELSTAARQELEHARDHDRRADLREIAAGLLKLADGLSARQVALTGLLKPRDPDTVYRWLDKYQQQGLAGLVHRPRSHRGYSPRRGGTPPRPGARAS